MDFEDIRLREIIQFTERQILHDSPNRRYLRVNYIIKEWNGDCKSREDRGMGSY